MKKLLAPLTVLAFATGMTGLYVTAFYAGDAHAQVVDAGVGSGSSAGSGSATAPADQLHDVISNPAQAYGDLVAAKSLGWPVLVFAVGLMLARLLGKLGSLGGVLSFLAPLGVGKVAVVIGGAAAVLASAYNAAFAHGSVIAIATAALLTLATYWDSHSGVSSSSSQPAKS